MAGTGFRIATDRGPVQPTRLAIVDETDECAGEKARQLMYTALPDDIWLGFTANDAIEFTGRRGTYLILPHSQTKIYAAGTGHCVAYACLQLSIAAPDYDRMLAEYLILKNDEDYYWKTANLFGPASDVVVFLLATIDVCWFLYLLGVFHILN